MTDVIQQNHFPKMFTFLKEEKMTNVTLTAEGKIIKAHKLMLAAASQYFEELFSMLGDKHPVIVLKDVSVKYLLLILEYIYCGQVDLAPEEVDEFKRVAESIRMKVAFNVVDSKTESELEKKNQDQAGVSSTFDEEMVLTECDDPMEPTLEDPMESSGSSSKTGPMTLSISSVKTLCVLPKQLSLPSPDSIQSGPPPKKIKIKQESTEMDLLPSKKKIPLKQKVIRPIALTVQCIHCDSKIREKDRNYHQKFCWKNINRIETKCTLCLREFQFPTMLRIHVKRIHDQSIK